MWCVLISAVRDAVKTGGLHHAEGPMLVIYTRGPVHSKDASEGI